MRAARRWLGLVLLGASLAGCGFQLRGVQPGVAGLTVAVASPTPYGELEQILSDAIRQADMTVVESGETPAMRIRLRDEKLTRRVQTVNTTGRASDYELILTVEYTIEQVVAGEDARTRRLDARREYNYDNTELLGKAEEEALLVQEMRRDIAARLLRQLAYQAAAANQAK